MKNRIKLFFINLKRWFGYWKVIKSSFNFDFSSMLFVELHQLIALRNCINKYHSIEGYEIDVRNMDLAINCLYVVLEGEVPFKEDYRFNKAMFFILKNGTVDKKQKKSKYEVMPYVNIKNSSRFISKKLTNTEKVNTYVLQQLRIDKAWHLYNKIRIEHLMEWWD